MTDFVHVTDGAIDAGPGPLPASWGAPDGTTYAALEDIPTDKLAVLGWLPVQDVIPDHDPLTAQAAPLAVELVKGVAVRNWTLVSTVPGKQAQEDNTATDLIDAVVPLRLQLNMLAQSVQLLYVGLAPTLRAAWTPQQAAAWDAGQAIWNKVALIRAVAAARKAEIAATGVPKTEWPA